MNLQPLSRVDGVLSSAQLDPMRKSANAAEIGPIASQPTPPSQQPPASAADLVLPDGMVFGVSHGQPPWLAGGHFGILSFKDGSLSYFGAKSLSGPIANPFDLAGRGRLGIVGTAGPQGQEAGPGFAGKVPTPIGDVVIFGNFRQDGLTVESLARMIEQTKAQPGRSLTLSINLGAAYSVSDAALLGLTAASAGKLTGLQRGVDASGLDAWLGLGWRASVTFKNGEIDHFNISGLRIRPQDLGDFLATQLDRPSVPVIPNGGDSRIASLNDTVQALFGQSPWDIGRAAMLRRDGELVLDRHGGVDVRNHGNAIVALTEPIYELATAAGLLLPGEAIRDNAHAGALIEQLYELHAGDATAQWQLTARLLNPYNLTFGSETLAAALHLFQGNSTVQAVVNQMRQQTGLAALSGTPPRDYEFVRNVFEGHYRWLGDNPPRNAPERRPGL
jgi:hypothetical protein